MAKVVVVGSCMIDLTCFAPRLPKCGETLFGTSFQRDFGGKGANQCIAATRLGADTALVACLGNDVFGKEYIAHLKSNNVDTRHVYLVDGVSCGIAQISVADNGDNHIIIVPGANNHLNSSKVQAATDVLSQAKTVLFQFETPLSTTVEALKFCKLKNPSCITVVNAAPAVAVVDLEIFKQIDILCLNESEAQLMTKQSTSTVADCEVALRQLLSYGCGTVIITLGKEGSLFGTKDDEQFHHEPGNPIANPVDTTGAGDAFLGALAFLLAYRPRWSLKRMVQASSFVAAQSIMKRGTQASFPCASDLPPSWFAD